MHTIDHTVLGALILVLLAGLVVVKRRMTGSILERPQGGALLWLVNAFNLFFLLAANPLAAILLVTHRLDGADPTFLAMNAGWIRTGIELGGLAVYLSGFCLMGWALASLGQNYQLGGTDPRVTDALVVSGPYAIIRHPMYTAALCIAFGLSCVIQSLACLGAFMLYLVLILLLIPAEEGRLLRAYGEAYAQYRRKVKALVPFVG